ncbi:hypothetical protein M099_3584 [Phocaeicola vulgatus str. 3975 RP4]|uniref:Uncharacterized protein n=1 Tax=Phocaeicola vulgatus str. 3975 RP4 TaxID=1339352 RepID=A0A069S744_PHOVU|nr:hypothetical protein M099_3584 [Phocaeicola vulgatus str. 3975 RP4]
MDSTYIDLLNYMLKYKIPQIVTLTRGSSLFYVLKKDAAITFSYFSI